jgi:hypothetical protein
MILLAVRDDRLRLLEAVQHDHQLAPFDLLHLAGEQLAHLAREFLADPAPFTLAHPLDDPLLGPCTADAELLEGNFLLEHVSGLELGVELAGVVHADLPARILDRVHDLAQPHHANAAPELVDRHLELDVGAELPRQRGVNPILQQGQEFPAIELLAELPECRRISRRTAIRVSCLPSFGPVHDELRLLNVVQANVRSPVL